MNRINLIYNKFIEPVNVPAFYGWKFALGRTMLSLSTLCSILFNDPNRIFNISFQQHPNIKTYALAKLSIFNICYPDNLILAKYIACALLIISILGFLPRFFGIIQWWLSLSFYSSSYIIEGGDQINMILSFLLVPLTIFDYRVNHWKQFKRECESIKPLIYFVLILIKIQVSILYIVAGISKFSNVQWREGTALYYWAINNSIGFNYAIEAFSLKLFDNRVFLFIATWSVILFELLLGLVPLKSWYNRKLLYSALFFHFLIFIFFGLFTFMLSMSGALFLYFITLNPKKNE